MFFVSFMAILWQGETIATSLDATTTGPLSKIFECRTFILIWNISLYSTLQNKSLHSFTEQYQRTRDNNNYCFCDDYSYCEERGHHPSPSPPLFISNRPVTPPAGCFEYRTQVRLTLTASGETNWCMWHVLIFDRSELDWLFRSDFTWHRFILYTD